MTVISNSKQIDDIFDLNVKHLSLEGNAATTELKRSNAFMNMFNWYEQQMNACKSILQTADLKQIIKYIKSNKFDLIISDVSNGANCLLAFSNLVSKVPIVGLSNSIISSQHFELSGSADINTAIIPYFLTRYGDNMSYWQRVYNSVLYAASHL